MKKLKSLLAPLFIFFQKNKESQINDLLNDIRHNRAELRAFFQQMPKGADLHHHYSGSVYAETYIQTVETENLWLNTETLKISKGEEDIREKELWYKISSLKEKGLWEDIKEELLRTWSVKDYPRGSLLPPDLHFFNTFFGFEIPASMNIATGLNELKTRAINEGVQYIETIFMIVPFQESKSPEQDYNQILTELQRKKSGKIQDSLNVLAEHYLTDAEFDTSIIKYNKFVADVHEGIDDDKFMMRYQNYVIRVLPPTDVFKSLLAAFSSASKSDLIVGVNIVATEHDSTSMNDYWLHMQMFKFCRQLFPDVKYAMHAGELKLGLVKPEELSWHVEAAVEVAGAYRIGHGVDIMYETNRKRVLKYMRENNIAIEINLSSNEFILGIKGYDHPVTIYVKHKVPIVICSDDAGGLRSDLTEQFVLLANRYPEISYSRIKEYIFNSIRYSFLNSKDKLKIEKALKTQLDTFEKNLINEFTVH